MWQLFHNGRAASKQAVAAQNAGAGRAFEHMLGKMAKPISNENKLKKKHNTKHKKPKSNNNNKRPNTTQ